MSARRARRRGRRSPIVDAPSSASSSLPRYRVGSARDDDGTTWITPAGVDKGSLTRDDIVRVRPDGTAEGRHRPSSELPFHRAVVRDEAFTSEPFTVHNRWIETEFDNDIPPFVGAAEATEDAEPREKVVVEVGGRRLEVSLPAGLGASTGGGGKKGSPKRSAKKASGAAASGDSLTSPMQGTIVKVAVEDGATVEAGDLIVVLEAMKMEQPLTAHKDGVVKGLDATAGATVPAGHVLLQIV